MPAFAWLPPQAGLYTLVASPVFVIYRSSRPRLSSLGRVPGVPGAFTDLGRHTENTPVPGMLILRLDGPLYYANALTTRDKIKLLVDEEEPPPKVVILDATAQDQVDPTSMKMLPAANVPAQVVGQSSSGEVVQ